MKEARSEAENVTSCCPGDSRYFAKQNNSIHESKNPRICSQSVSIIQHQYSIQRLGDTIILTAALRGPCVRATVLEPGLEVCQNVAGRHNKKTVLHAPDTTQKTRVSSNTIAASKRAFLAVETKQNDVEMELPNRNNQ